MKIMLDAGHYGYANQSPVVPEYYESRRMWVLCEYLAEELAVYGFEVFKTRDDIDVDRAIVARGEMAKGCDLFLSIHSNAVGNYGNEKIDRVDVYAAYDNLNNSHELAKLLAVAIADCMGVSGGAVQTRKSENGDWEYYGVLRGARSVGCPLFYILEHSFHTNTYATKWL
ncbi:MAG: N-acetylmuramoyl-L-alanine amidase, partial [Clostridia bacterium]|nr:N-acetylmuramoyl-L-alanine amidase [Clostridia bacterium]